MSDNQNQRGTVTALRKQHLVAAEAYLQEWNWTEAARIANYKHPNKRGWELSQRADIQDYIRHRLDEMKLSSDRVMVEIAKLASSDMTDFLQVEEGLPVRLDLHQASERGKLSLLRKFKETDKGGIEIELYDKMKALELLGRHHKLFTDKTELTGKDGEALQTVVNINIPDNGRPQ